MDHAASAVLMHPAPGIRTDDEVDYLLWIQAQVRGKPHGLGRGQDVNGGQDLMEHLHVAAGANATGDEI